MLVQLSANQVERLLQRSQSPGEKRPEAERREALDVLSSGSDSELEVLEDYHFLARSSPDRNLVDSARRLLEFERRLKDEDQARLALTALESRRPTPVLEKAFDRTLELTGEVELTLEMYDLCEQNQEQGERLLSTLEQVARVTRGQNLAPLMRTWIQNPPSPGALEAATQLADQVRMPGWRPDDDWRVTREDDRLAWSLVKKDSYSELTSEEVSLQGLTRCQLHFSAKHSFEDNGKVEVTAREPRESTELLTTLQGRQGWTDYSLDLSKFSGKTVELEFDREGRGNGLISVDDISVSGFIPDQSRTFEFASAGDWTEISTEHGKTWSDSPQGNLGHNLELTMVSEQLSLKGLSGAALAFDANYDLENSHDRCLVEVRTAQQEWKEVGYLTGEEKWGANLINLAEYDGQEVQVRFRTKTDNSRESQGVEIANLRLVGNSPQAERVEIRIDGHRDDRTHEQSLVDFLLKTPPEERDRAYQAVADLAERTKEVGAALSLWPSLEGRPENLPQQIEALGKLWPEFEKKTPGLYEMLLRNQEPGDDLTVLADLMISVGPEGYDLLRRRLQAGAPDEAGRNANLDFFAQLTHDAAPEVAERAYRVAALPVGRESLADRRELFLEMAEMHRGDLEQTTAAWRATTRWLAGEELTEALGSYQTLLYLVDEKAAPALHAVEFIREHQMRGALGLSLKECVDLMASGLLSGPDNLDQALLDLLHQDGDSEIDIDEEGIQIGDTWIDTDYYVV